MRETLEADAGLEHVLAGDRSANNVALALKKRRVKMSRTVPFDEMLSAVAVRLLELRRHRRESRGRHDGIAVGIAERVADLVAAEFRLAWCRFGPVDAARHVDEEARPDDPVEVARIACRSSWLPPWLTHRLLNAV